MSTLDSAATYPDNNNNSNNNNNCWAAIIRLTTLIHWRFVRVKTHRVNRPRTYATVPYDAVESG